MWVNPSAPSIAIFGPLPMPSVKVYGTHNVALMLPSVVSCNVGVLRIHLVDDFIHAAIVKLTQLCSKFPPTALLNFACDWLALGRDISFGWLTSISV